MNTYNHLNLFFNTAIEDNQYIIRSFFTWDYEIEKKANVLMSESRYWLGGKTVKLYNDYFILIPESRHYTSTIEKIKSVVKAIFLFAIGIILKSIVWFANPVQVYIRNHLIFKFNLKQNQFSKKFQSKTDTPIVFSIPNAIQDQSRLLSQPPEVLNNIISFLDDKSQAHLAKACKLFYNYVTQFNAVYPSVIYKMLNHQFFSNLSQAGDFPGEFYEWFRTSRLVSSLLDGEDLKLVNFFSRQERNVYVGNIGKKKSILEKIFKSMGGQSIQLIKNSQVQGLMFRLKENCPNSPQTIFDLLVILIKIQQKWHLCTFNASGGLRMFLSDICYHNEAPKLVEYLQRLLKGEPCGSFPDDFNDKFKVNFQKEKASDILVEGPRLCSDGKTPILQLWPPKQQINSVKL